MFMQPAAPGFHQAFSLSSGALMQMQHSAGSTPAGTALGIGIKHLLLLEKIDCLMQHCFGESQFWMITLKALKQS